MNTVDRNEQEISQATRDRIDEFSRELALAFKRILEESKEGEDIQFPSSIKANPISDDEENSTK